MLDPNFDPLQIMEDLNHNQVSLQNNQTQLAIAFNQLSAVVKSQQETIDILIENLETTNKANEVLLRGLAADIQGHLKPGVK